MQDPHREDEVATTRDFPTASPRFHVLHGPDEYSITKALDHIKASLGSPEALAPNTQVLDGGQVSFQELAMVCNTIPFLADYRLVVVEGLFERFETVRARKPRKGASKDDGPLGEWSGLVDLVRALPPTTTLVLVSAKIGPANVLLKGLHGLGTAQRFDAPRGQQLERWITQRAKEADGRFTPQAVRALADFSGGSLRMLGQEVAKLVTYAGDAAVDEADVHLLTSSSRETGIFELIDAFVTRRRSKAMRSLEQLLVQGTPPPVIVTMLARQFRLMVQAKSLIAGGVRETGVGKELGLRSDYAARKTVEQARSYTIDALKDLYTQLLDTDLAIKTGRLDGALALEMLVASQAAPGSNLPDGQAHARLQHT